MREGLHPGKAESNKLIMEKISEAIVLAGGFGTRLRNVVKDVPKPMADINGKPFLHYLIKYYISKGIEHVILSVGYMNEVIKDYFGDSYEGIKIDYAVEDHPLGTGGAIIKSLGFAGTENVMVANGDTMFMVEPSEILNFHNSKDADITIVIREVEDVSRYGSILTDNEQRITGFSEKQNSKGRGYINGGVYLINKPFISKFSFPGKFSIEKDFFEKEFKNHKFYGKPCNNYFIDIGIPEDYSRAQKKFKKLFP